MNRRMQLAVVTLAALALVASAAFAANGKVDFSGKWKFNADKSDSMRGGGFGGHGRGMGPGAGGGPMGGGAMGPGGGFGARGMSRGDRDRRGMRDREITISQKDAAVTIHHQDGRDETFYTDGRVTKSTDPMGDPVEVSAKWDGSKLVITRSGESRSMHETWDLTDSGKRLTMTVEMSRGNETPVRTTHRVFDLEK